ncbi:MAG: porphobilinogen synthase [Desulfovibrio sp.]|jgi:porphobilinogen synthase|nr:porphobilinogen synthase [Desulfovibrio sp.]
MFHRGRRLRGTPHLRAMTRETRLDRAQLVMPYFVEERGKSAGPSPIAAMPGQFRYSPDELVKALEQDARQGLAACLLFGIPADKDPAGRGAYAGNGVVQTALRKIKDKLPDLYLITDVCLCEYTDHGHCGLIGASGEVLNDETLELLARVALSHAEAGADMIAPSDMMDGRIGVIRNALDENGFTSIPIMAYAVKYASAYYGPFREAAASAPRSGDRKSYQMDPANRLDALREAAADIKEGADIIMVKPAGPYLDVIREVRNACTAPLAAYQVSGEYALIRSAAELGRIDETAVILESLLGIKRAGADIIITYFTRDILRQGLL